MADKWITTDFDEITYKIIGCAMAVHRELGPGLREDNYQKALENKLTDCDFSFEAQKYYEVYEDPNNQRLVGYYIPDYVVEGAVIVEIKALNGLDNSHLAQIIGYMAVSGCTVGLLINFGERSLRYRRVFPPQKITKNLVIRQWLFIPDWLKQDQDHP